MHKLSKKLGTASQQDGQYRFIVLPRGSPLLQSMLTFIFRVLKFNNIEFSDGRMVDK
jgi:hypothetical protein